MTRGEAPQCGGPMLNNVKVVSQKILRCDEKCAFFKIHSKITQNSPKTFANPPKTLSKSPQNQSQRPLGVYLAPMLQKSSILNFKRTGQEALKSARETPQSVSNGAQDLPKLNFSDNFWLVFPNSIISSTFSQVSHVSQWNFTSCKL